MGRDAADRLFRIFFRSHEGSSELWNAILLLMLGATMLVGDRTLFTLLTFQVIEQIGVTPSFLGWLSVSLGLMNILALAYDVFLARAFITFMGSLFFAALAISFLRLGGVSPGSAVYAWLFMRSIWIFYRCRPDMHWDQRAQ